MTSTFRRLAAATAPALLVLSLTACGGDDAAGSPENASVEDYCTAFNADSQFDDPSAEQIQDYGKKLAEVGTPAEISGDARDGFVAFVDFLSGIEGDDVTKLSESGDPQDVFPKDDLDKISAFFEKTFTLCQDS
ncbi:hypothetical protein [Nocardioides sp.]|uniref:hypothetical protein n=1 Tax=Nocardioides sp. TaxID=35761 RepID=UPI003516F3C5